MDEQPDEFIITLFNDSLEVQEPRVIYFGPADDLHKYGLCCSSPGVVVIHDNTPGPDVFVKSAEELNDWFNSIPAGGN